MNTDQLPRLPLGTLPTPIQKLSRLGEELGIELWVKRDDLTGLAFGGNKTRKLEYLLADAQRQGARTVLTVGAVQSNHCRQTAAAAARAGFDCVLVLTGEEPASMAGNVLLDHLLGAELRWVADEERSQALQRAVSEAEAEGRMPYLIPYGGSNHLGVSAFMSAIEELVEQKIEVDRIVLASSSGGTQAGMILGAARHGFEGKITGISVDPSALELRSIIQELVATTTDFLGDPPAEPPGPIDIVDRYRGGGYAVVGDFERRAIHRFARTEALLLDPVYTGRAAGGLLDLVERGEIEQGERLLFWHSGGTPALFSFTEELF